MILCHKCSGLLSHGKTEDINGLLHCMCISSYVRGFEPILSRPQAIEQQITQTASYIQLYRQQGRAQSWIDTATQTKTNLENLLSLPIDYSI